MALPFPLYLERTPMARLDHVHPAMRAALLAMACPTFDTQPWVTGPALPQRRVALISTAGLHRRDDRPFAVTPGSARAIAWETLTIDNLQVVIQVAAMVQLLGMAHWDIPPWHQVMHNPGSTGCPK